MEYASNQSHHASHGDVIDSTDPFHHVSQTRDLVVLTILAILIIVINGLMTLCFVLDKKLRRRPANLMIFSQACTDLFTGVVFIPIYLVRNEIAHTLLLFLSCYMLYLSLFNLLVISIDRYLALCKPFLHRKLIDVRRTTKMIVAVWVAPLGFTMIPLTWWFGEIETKIKATKIYICTMWMLMLVLVVTMTILYVVATRRAKKTIRNRRAKFRNRAKEKADMALASKELRVVHLFGLLLFFFVAAYFPILYINFCSIIGREEYAPPEIEVISLYLLIVNSVINPVLCFMLKRDYLEAIKKICRPEYEYADIMTFVAEAGTFIRKFSRDNTKKSIKRKTTSQFENIEMKHLVGQEAWL